MTGLDFSGEMLVRARRKSETIAWVQGDVLGLPFADGGFDCVTVGFGVRNVAISAPGCSSCDGFCDPAAGSRFSRSRSREGSEAVLLAVVRPRRAGARPRAARR